LEMHKRFIMLCLPRSIVGVPEHEKHDKMLLS